MEPTLKTLIEYCKQQYEEFPAKNSYYAQQAEILGEENPSIPTGKRIHSNGIQTKVSSNP
jgi:hypothetical protein